MIDVCTEQKRINKYIWKNFKKIFINKKNDNYTIIRFVKFKSESIILNYYNIEKLLKIFSQMNNWKDLITNAIIYCLDKSKRKKLDKKR